jgi:outer membrane lipoprotein carrier protein
VLALILLSHAANAQPAAGEIAKRVDQHYNQLHTLKAGFTEQFDGLGMHRSDSGVLLLEKPGKMRWDYQSTPGKLFLLDGKYAWFYSPGDPQVQRLAASQLDDLRSPLRFLLGHTKLENELTGLTLGEGQAGAFTLAGVPKGQEKRVSKLSLTVSATGSILSILIEEVDGARTSFVFSNEEMNPSIPESEFHFVAPEGVPVVDALPPV